MNLTVPPTCTESQTSYGRSCHSASQDCSTDDAVYVVRPLKASALSTLREDMYAAVSNAMKRLRPFVPSQRTNKHSCLHTALRKADDFVLAVMLGGARTTFTSSFSPATVRDTRSQSKLKDALAAPLAHEGSVLHTDMRGT